MTGQSPYRIYDQEEEDEEYRSEADRARDLGIHLPDQDGLYSGPEVDAEEFIPYDMSGPVDPVQTAHTQPLVPGYIEFRLSNVARARGLVNRRGAHRGKVSLSVLLRGTALAGTTLVPLLKNSPDVKGIHFSSLARLCEFLKCTPGDLMVYHSGLRASDPRAKPLR